MVMLQALAVVAVYVGLITALLDMGMNGARYAGWAPFGLALAAVGGLVLLISGG